MWISGGNHMTKYFCLQRRFRNVSIELLPLDWKDEVSAWAQIEEEIAGCDSQEWLLSEYEVRELKKCLEARAEVLQ